MAVFFSAQESNERAGGRVLQAATGKGKHSRSTARRKWCKTHQSTINSIFVFVIFFRSIFRSSSPFTLLTSEIQADDDDDDVRNGLFFFLFCFFSSSRLVGRSVDGNGRWSRAMAGHYDPQRNSSPGRTGRRRFFCHPTCFFFFFLSLSRSFPFCIRLACVCFWPLSLQLSVPLQRSSPTTAAALRFWI